MVKHTCVQRYVSMYTLAEVRDTSPGNTFFTYSFEARSNLELGWCSSTTSDFPGSSSLHIMLRLQELLQPCLGYYMGSRDLNSDPHVYTASVLTYRTISQAPSWVYLLVCLINFLPVSHSQKYTLTTLEKIM